jgi:hypothetical protein
VRHAVTKLAARPVASRPDGVLATVVRTDEVVAMDAEMTLVG